MFNQNFLLNSKIFFKNVKKTKKIFKSFQSDLKNFELLKKYGVHRPEAESNPYPPFGKAYRYNKGK